MRLIDAVWAYRSVFKSHIGMYPYRIIYEKACHFPIELEHKSYWAVKMVNFNLDKTSSLRKIQMNELEEIKRDAYQSTGIYKEKMKFIHDQSILRKFFQPSQEFIL